jgi:flagellar biogenesis protein FliO
MLSGRRSLMLVRVRGQTLLLGVTSQSINCLTEIHEMEGEWARPADNEGAVSSPFEQKLGKFVDQTINEANQKSS